MLGSLESSIDEFVLSISLSLVEVSMAKGSILELVLLSLVSLLGQMSYSNMQNVFQNKENLNLIVKEIYCINKKNIFYSKTNYKRCFLLIKLIKKTFLLFKKACSDIILLY